MHGKGQPWPERSSYARQSPGFSKIDLSVIEIIAGITPYQLKVRIPQNPPNLPRNPSNQRPRRNNRPLRNNRSGSNNRPRPNLRPIQNNSPNANQHIVLQNAPMNRGIMPNRDTIANNHGIHVPLPMNNGAILHIRPRPNANLVHIAPNHSIHPDAGALAKNNISKHLRRGIDIASRGNGRVMALIRTKHGIEFIGVKHRLTTP